MIAILKESERIAVETEVLERWYKSAGNHPDANDIKALRRSYIDANTGLIKTY